MYHGWCIDIQSTPLPYGQVTRMISRHIRALMGMIAMLACPLHTDWDKVNYILNIKIPDDWRITQAAIWHFDGQSWGSVSRLGLVYMDMTQ